MNYFFLVISLLLVSNLTMSLAQNRSHKTRSTKSSGLTGEVRLITLDPGHFHASLVQKVMYPSVSPVVSVFALPGLDLDEHLKRVAAYNARSTNPTNWKENVYTGPDFFARMLVERPGNVVVIAGKNRDKIDYIDGSLNAGLHVLADKPMCIDVAGFQKLRASFKTAAAKNLLLYDIMTERYEITTILQKALVNDRSVFGRLRKGSVEQPAVTKESVHYLFKSVSGKPLRRPAWFFDTSQQGEGLVDITTHLVDLIQWESFPEQAIALADIRLLRSRRWPTVVTREQFAQVTGSPEFPDYLRDNLNSDGDLLDYANGELSYTLKGVHARVSVTWNFAAPAGAGDAHFSVMRGTKANVFIRQGKEENYRPELYVEAAGLSQAELPRALRHKIKELAGIYPGLELRNEGSRWHVVIPDKFRADHEAHFGQVMEKFLTFLCEGKLPDWEVPNMIAKYYTTTAALELARGHFGVR
ncbi:MAG TPA: putative oxidoreductase C-terminal domain-containing protein [Pyrinomonadaceae bacterium]|nr:putative oxidoreductase C-terminal domain-containing protein [Pyrinomonadaceae bacterium]